MPSNESRCLLLIPSNPESNLHLGNITYSALSSFAEQEEAEKLRQRICNCDAMTSIILLPIVDVQNASERLVSALRWCPEPAILLYLPATFGVATVRILSIL